MPYLLLALGCLIGLYTLYRFMLKANIHQIKALFLSCALIAMVIALLFMAITGRLAAALALMVAMAPVIKFIIDAWNADKKKKQDEERTAPNYEVSSVSEAYQILGLEDGASADEIEQAHKRLIKKVHPDAEGSEWMAAKLNAAKDLLLDKKDS